jgi:hemerythrin-like domain-containing protein
MKPTEVLITEHNAVLLALKILEKAVDRLAAGAADALEHIDQLIDFFRGFVDKCHHAKEEEVLFPELQKRGLPREGGPIGVMLAEHDAGRRLVRKMSEGLEHLRGGNGDAVRTLQEDSNEYRDLLRGHIDKENNVLFPMADRLLSDDDGASIIERFEAIERDRVGAGKHEAYHEMLHRLRDAHRV